jgi:hypothetical protein
MAGIELANRQQNLVKFQTRAHAEWVRLGSLPHRWVSLTGKRRSRTCLVCAGSKADPQHYN